MMKITTNLLINRGFLCERRRGRGNNITHGQDSTSKFTGGANAGNVHFRHGEPFGPAAAQYVGAPGFEGESASSNSILPKAPQKPRLSASSGLSHKSYLSYTSHLVPRSSNSVWERNSLGNSVFPPHRTPGPPTLNASGVPSYSPGFRGTSYPTVPDKIRSDEDNGNS